MKKARLHLAIDGASPEEIARGIAAAAEVFNREDVYPVDAENAVRERRLEARPLTGEEAHLAAVWDEAERAAIGACSRAVSDPLTNSKVDRPVLALRWSD